MKPSAGGISVGSSTYGVISEPLRFRLPVMGAKLFFRDPRCHWPPLRCGAREVPTPPFSVEKGDIILLTDPLQNNLIIYDSKGKLVSKWGAEFPGSHGLYIVSENDRQLLFITDLGCNALFKPTLDGEMLEE